MDMLQTLIWLKRWYNENKAGLQSQPALVKAIKADSALEARISQLYFALFNKTLSGCGSCLADAFVELYQYSQKNVVAIMKCQFKLKSGVLLCDSNNVLPMATAANLTDEIAIAYLADNPARKSMFEKLPDNVDGMIKAQKMREAKAAKEAARVAAEEEERLKAEAEQKAAEEAAAEAANIAAKEAATADLEADNEESNNE